MVHDLVDPGVINVTFVEDVSAVPFGTNDLNDLDTGSSSDLGVTRINAHLVQFVSSDATFGTPGDTCFWSPIAGYAFSPATSVVS
jgi:hypothetical protein